MNRRICWQVPTIVTTAILAWLVWTILGPTPPVHIADFETSQIRDDILLVGNYDQTNPVSQTFVAEKPYLSSVHFLLSSVSAPNYPGLPQHLFIRLEDNYHQLLALQTISVPKSTGSAEIVFSFPPQRDSINKTYYLVIYSDAPSGQISFWTSRSDAYPRGEVFLSGLPSDFDLTFWTYYSPPFFYWLSKTLTSDGLRFLGLILITLVFFILGTCLAVILGWNPKDAIEGFIISFSLGTIVLPLLYTTVSLIGIKANKFSLGIALLILITLAIMRATIILRKRPRVSKLDWTYQSEIWLLGLIFFIALVSRVAQIHDLVVPNWIDGIVHVDFISKILERGFVAFGTVYPKGFHINAVFGYLLLNTTLPEATLLMGQWLSLASGLTYYLLARRLLKVPYALLGLCLYWFWATFPGFLINWSRYPFLQGLVLLPVVVVVYQDFSFKRSASLAVLILLLTGLGLTYYGTFLMFVAFVTSDFLSQAFREGISAVLRKAKYILFIMLPIAVIFSVRLYHAFGSGVMGQDSMTSLVPDSLHTSVLSFSRGDWLIWIFAIIGYILAFNSGAQELLLLGDWVLIMITFNMFQLIGGITISSLANTIIFLSVPMALLSGYTFQKAIGKTIEIPRLASTSAILLIAVVGAYRCSGIVQPSVVLFLPSDQQAMEWINQDTPANSVFLINSMAWGDITAPSDGGGWISFLAGRRSILFDPINSTETLDLEQIEYAYVGRGYGELNSDLLGDRCGIVPVYNLRGIRIYKCSHSNGK